MSTVETDRERWRRRAAGWIGIGITTLLLTRFTPGIVGMCLLVLAGLIAAGGLAVALFVHPPPSLVERSVLMRQLAWLVRFLTAALLLGLSAVTAVAAQADWDAAKDRGAAAQLHALYDAVRTPLLVASALGVAFVACRLGTDLFRAGSKERDRAVGELQNRCLGRQVPMATTALRLCAHPIAASVTLLIVPLFIEARVSAV